MSHHEHQIVSGPDVVLTEGDVAEVEVVDAAWVVDAEVVDAESSGDSGGSDAA